VYELTYSKRCGPWLDQLPSSSCENSASRRGSGANQLAGLQCPTRLEIVGPRAELGLRSEGNRRKEAVRDGDHRRGEIESERKEVTPRELANEFSKEYNVRTMHGDLSDAPKKIRELQDRINHLEGALRRIANTDYRGNRSTESQIAFEALKEAK
jgi:hypothetical protein